MQEKENVLQSAKSVLILKPANKIKQAVQGLFTTGTSDQKEKVGGKRGLTPRFVLPEGKP